MDENNEPYDIKKNISDKINTYKDELVIDQNDDHDKMKIKMLKNTAFG